MSKGRRNASGGKNDWYSKKWGNPRALVRKAEKRAKHSRSVPDAVGASSGIQEQATSADHIARVAEVHRNHCLVLWHDDFVHCDLNSKDLNLLSTLVVGDRVIVERERDRCLLRDVLPRFSKLARARGDATRRSAYALAEHVVAANVDNAIIVAAAASPPFHPRFIDRYLVICQYGNVQPIICINKIDLVENPPDLETYSSMNIPIVYTSAETDAGLSELRRLLQNQISAFVGHSGVGKSSLINRLLGEQRLRVAGVSVRHGRGRHTTVSSTLHRLSPNSYVIDTPGVRSLGLWGIDKQVIRFYFPDLAGFSHACRFTDCSHTIEPGCNVKAAVATGELPKSRYDSYLRLMGE